MTQDMVLETSTTQITINTKVSPLPFEYYNLPITRLNYQKTGNKQPMEKTVRRKLKKKRLKVASSKKSSYPLGQDILESLKELNEAKRNGRTLKSARSMLDEL